MDVPKTKEFWSHPLSIPVSNEELSAALAEVSRSQPLRLTLDRIERLNISADVKALLRDLSRITLRVGEAVVSIGRKIIDFAFELVKSYPSTTFGLATGLIVGTLVAGIPLLGPLLGPILTPLLSAFGLTLGALEDLKDGGVRRRIDALERSVATVLANA
ncbi:hypothetical protein [Cereibacter sphaeroides]|uniref:hypothetical protein n=1 Tax=Cereibacter sphaeroides TaxID=1063 RepID=UPI0011C348D1|nr:hypothetical protein [Cereibacter sphaeroides]